MTSGRHGKAAGRPPRRGAGTALALAGLIGAGALGLALSGSQGPALADITQGTSGGGIMTPYGRAPLTFADIVEKVSPAVVSIHVTNGGGKHRFPRLSRRHRGGPDVIPGLPKDHPLRKFFKRFGERGRGMPKPGPSLAQGSGFIISPDGYVVTNNHVVAKASRIEVSFREREKYVAKLIGRDPRTDVALLKIDAKRPLPYVRFATRPVRVGDWVLAIGNPFGLGGTVTAGIVSARGRNIGSGPYDYIQIDAAVNRGNSGGPAFNLQGEVVGVNTAIYSPSGGNVGIAFAVPADIVRKVVADLRDKGKVSRGWLGVHIQDVTEDIAASLGMAKTHGALVTKVTKGGPAAHDGVHVGDAIIAVNGDEVRDSRDLARKIASYAPGTTVRVGVVRDGARKTISVRLGTFPAPERLAALEQGKPASTEVEDLGLTLAPASEAGGDGKEGVVITEVDPTSEAAIKGLRPGDVILEVSSEPVSTPEDVARGVRKARERGRKAVLMRVRSGGQQRFIALPLKKA